MREIKVLNLGAGVQSTTLYLMSMRQDEPEFVPVFDCAIFSDTQEEPKAVYDHLEWLKSLGGPPIITTTAGSLGDDLLAGKNSTGQSLTRFASIPTFCIGEGDEEPGRNKRQCTKEYKTDPVEQCIRREVVGLQKRKRFPEDIRIHQYLGLSYDEPGRVAKVRSRFAGNVDPTPFLLIHEFREKAPKTERQPIRWAVPHFPLFEMEWTRGDCQSYLKETVPDREIPRSACVFCPYRRNEEWRLIRNNDPVGWARAIQIDEALRSGARAAEGTTKTMYLHRSCVPLAVADLDEVESQADIYFFGLNAECEGMCGL